MEQDRENFIAGLRELATWYEQRPDVPIPIRSTLMVFAEGGDTSFVGRLGGFRKIPLDTWMTLVRAFGQTELQVTWKREDVCTRRVVGTETVPMVPARAAYTREIVEWDCAPMLGAAAEGSLSP